MRLLRLLLSPYGSHERTELTLGPSGTFDVIYGPNEAGKSTLRRSIVSLLYGIDERTSDAHRFPGKDLRITADVLALGETRTVTRRKGRKATLTDLEGTPLDESFWARALSGVTREAYERGFGLDHELLRRGAEALLSGDADLGESLLSASLGAVNLGKFRAGLWERADEIYSDKAKKKPLNEAMVAYAAKKKNARDYSMNSERYVEQKQALADAETERAQAEARRAELVVEKQRATKRVDLGALFAQRRVLMARLAELGDVPHVTEDAARARAAAEDTLNTAEAGLAGLSAEEEDLARAAATHETTRQRHAPLAHLDAEEFLTRRVDAEAARREHAQKQAELLSVNESIATLLGVLAGERPALPFASLAAMAARLSELGQELTRLSLQSEQERVQLARIDAELGESESTATPSSAEDLILLGASLAAAEELLERTRELPRLQAELRSLEEELATLPLVPNGVTLPDEAALTALAVEREPLLRTRTDVERELSRLRERAAQIDTELSALVATFALPSEDELLRARAERDAFLAAPKKLTEHLPELQAAVLHADALADRMRRESERVAQRARLTAEKDACDAQAKESHLALQRVERDLADLGRRHEGLFQGIPAPDASNARPFVRDARKGAGLRARAKGLGEQVLSLTREEAECAAKLASVLGTQAGPLRALTLAARERKAARESADKVEAERQEQRARRRREKAEHAATFQALVEQEKAALGRLDEVTRALSLPAGTSMEVAQQKTAALRAIADKEDQARALGVALEQSAARIRDLDESTVALFSALGLAEEPGGERRAQLIAERLKELAAVEATSREVEARRSNVKARRAELTQRRDAARRTLDAALAHTGAKTYAELPAFEERARARAKLLSDRTDLDLRIGEAGGDPGSPIEESEREAAMVRLPAMEEELSELEPRLHKAFENIGALRNGITLMEREETLSLTAQVEAEQELARITELSTRYARLVLTGMLLDERIETHRQENESDVLSHAGSLVSRITGGSIASLRPSFEDEEHPTLVCVRPDGKETPVAGLSDGAKDALYLSLRIASLAKLGRRGQALPVLLDDVLVHMDDDRAKVAVVALAELAQTTQVLFFTHHKRMVELCEAAIPKATLKVSSL